MVVNARPKAFAGATLRTKNVGAYCYDAAHRTLRVSTPQRCVSGQALHGGILPCRVALLIGHSVEPCVLSDRRGGQAFAHGFLSLRMALRMVTSMRVLALWGMPARSGDSNLSSARVSCKVRAFGRYGCKWMPLHKLYCAVRHRHHARMRE